MSLEEYVAAIQASKKYACVCEETLYRVVRAEMGKYKASKDVLKSAKTKLHQITAMFIGDGALAEAEGLLAAGAPDAAGETLQKLLALHTSTRERAPFAETLLADVAAVTGKGPVWDIACGFHPLLAGGYGFADYTATDINVRLVALIGAYFAAKGIPGRAFANDILYTVPPLAPDNVLLLKTAPLLEQQQKGYFARLLAQIPSEFFTVSFPTRSVSGRELGMAAYYRAFMEAALPRADYGYCLEKTYENELLYIVTKRKKAGVARE